MTENEKLRELLADIKEGQSRVAFDGFTEYLLHPDHLFRIDAALAEPVVAYRKHDAETCCCVDCCLLRQAREERDEARAEVERLRYALGRSESALCLVSEKWTKPAFERGQHLPSIRADLEVVRSTLRGQLDSLYDTAHWRRQSERAAYQRGAEAMREAAVKAIYDCYDRAFISGAIRDTLDAIRALSIPEDKP